MREVCSSGFSLWVCDGNREIQFGLEQTDFLIASNWLFALH